MEKKTVFEVQRVENGFVLASGGRTFVAKTREEMLEAIEVVLNGPPPSERPQETGNVRYAVPV